MNRLFLILALMVTTLLSAQTSKLRDREGHYIGCIITRPNNVQELRDKNGCYLGKYEPINNSTYDRRGKYVGKGNLLITLLKCG